MVVLGLASMAQFVVVLVRGVDLSIAASVRLAAIVAAILMDGSDGRFVVGALAAIGVSVVIGLVNGFIVTTLKVVPFIATLGIGAVVSGLALYMARTPTGRSSPWWQDLYGRTVGPIPVLVLLAGVIATGLWLLLAHTRWGGTCTRSVATPMSPGSAGCDPTDHGQRLRPRRLLAGVAGLVLIGGTGVGDSSARHRAGVRIARRRRDRRGQPRRRRGRLIGVFGGVVLFSMLGNVFNLLDVEVWYQQLVRGAVILVAAALYVQRRPKPVLRRRRRRRRPLFDRKGCTDGHDGRTVGA